MNSLIHCWVVKGTGRFADLMAALCENPNMDILNQEWFKETYKDKDDDDDGEKDNKRRIREDKVAMYLAICRNPLLHVFDLETDSFEELLADLEKLRSA